MSKVLISGYYGFHNAGDDSVLYGIITSLHKHNSEIELSVLSNDPEKTESMFHIGAYNRWNLLEVTKQIKKHDLLLMGGGSLLQDATSPRSVLYYLGLVFVAKLFRKPVVFYAQGVGPIQKSFSKRLIRHFVNKVDVLTVRDDASAEDLKSYGVTAPIVVTADPAVTIDPNSIEREIGANLLEKLSLDGSKTIAISVRSWKREQQYYREIAKAADYYAAQGWEILFIAMHYPNDITACKKIMEQMEHDASIIEEQLSFKEIMSLIANVRFVIGMRLHSVILAAIMNIPFVGISYDPKIDRFVKRLDMLSAGHITDLEANVLIDCVDQTLADEKAIKDNMQKKMQHIISEAERSSQLTIEQLNK